MDLRMPGGFFGRIALYCIGAADSEKEKCLSCMITGIGI